MRLTVNLRRGCDSPPRCLCSPQLRPLGELGIPDAAGRTAQASVCRPGCESAFVSAESATRQVLLVGSLPYADEAGTTNEQGFPVDFDSVTRLRPRVGPAELGRSPAPRLRHVPAPDVAPCRAPAGVARPARSLHADRAADRFRRRRRGFLSPPRALRYAPAFAACVAREATAVVQSIGAGNLLFQIEAPAEVVAAHCLPRPAVGIPTGPIIDLVRRLPTEVSIGIHLCFADLSNTAAITPSRFGRLVAFTNALARRWPPTHDLAYVHLPFAAGTSPAPTDPKSYRALSRLALPPGTRLAAGLVHEQPSLEPRSPPSHDRASQRPPSRHSHHVRPRPPHPQDSRRTNPPLQPSGPQPYRR